jgi:hypothetical protein
MAFVVGPIGQITRCAQGNHVTLTGTDDGVAGEFKFELHEVTELRFPMDIPLNRRNRILLRLYFRARDMAANTWTELRNAWANFSFET